MITGNYNNLSTSEYKALIIPYQVITGNYNGSVNATSSHYTIPSDNRELQRYRYDERPCRNYTIPSDNRELQREDGKYTGYLDYTIPSDNRELQQSRYQDHILAIIPYQVIMRKIRKVY